MPHRAILQTAVPEKLGIAALVTIIAAGERAINATFFLLLTLWAIDFVTGFMCMIRSGEKYSREKARNGLLKLFLIPLIGVCAAMIGALIRELPPHIDPDGKIILGAYAIVAVDYLQSIGRNMAVFFPGIDSFMGRVITIIKREDQAPEIEETVSRVIVEEQTHKRKAKRRRSSDEPS